MSVVSCSTTTTTAYKVTADTTGTLVLQTGATPTTAMTIDASQVVTFANQPTFTGGTANGVMYLNGSKVVTTGSALTFDGTNGATTGNWTAGNLLSTAGGYLRVNRSDNATYNEIKYVTSGDLFYFNQANGGAYQFNITGTEQMRLTSTGLGIGTSSPTTKLSITDSTGPIVRLVRTSNRFELSADNDFMSLNARDASTYITFKTADTERARIDSSGNLLVGKTTANYTTAGCWINPAGTFNSATAGIDFLNCYNTNAGAYRFFVNAAGTINATSTSITAISDVSLKENIRDLETGLTQVLALKPRRFDWKEETQIGEKDVAGFIAQEVEQVLPELVYEYKYNETETKKSIKMGDILPTLVKAIQEQQALITQLQADVAALKGA